MGLISRLKNSWNAFIIKEDKSIYIPGNYEVGSYYRPDRTESPRINDRSIMTSILNRISMDAASIDVRHCRLDKNNRYFEDIDSKLNNCLTLDTNLDQTSKMFFQDVVMSMLNKGCVAIVPVDTTANPNNTESYDILSMRVGEILEWYPSKVKVKVYNETTGKKEELVLDKRFVAIIENPFYAIMNEPNSTLQRLMLKMSLMDSLDSQLTTGKLDLIIQLPYSVKSEMRRKQAEDRRNDIEDQLRGSKYGIAYIDSVEKITQLNRPLENNLLGQVEFLTRTLYSQLGITDTILNGTANEEVMNNYYSRTIDPIISAITEEMIRKFLTKSARTQKQTIMYFMDPFSLIPVSSIAKIADTFTRNEILSSNEIRQIIGFKPSQDPSADELRNSNLNYMVGQPQYAYGGNPLQQYMNYRNNEESEEEPIDEGGQN